MTPPAPLPEALQAPGGILLLSCYELGHAPMGLASPAGFLTAAGFRPTVQDLAVHRLDEARVRSARFVGISVPMHTALRLGLGVAERVRALNPGAHLCFYGLYAGLNADLLLGGAADSVIGGEYEPALLALLLALEQGAGPPPSGVSTRRQRAAARIARTDFVPPERSGLPPLTDYARLLLPAEAATATGSGEHASKTVGYVEASRGCKHRCLHCPLTPAYDGRFFVVPRATVLADVASLVAQGAQHITFGDPDFFNGPTHARRLVDELHERWPALTYDATIKVEHLLQQRRLLPELARSGCLFIVTAVESLSDRVLRHLDKGHTREDALEALSIVREAGIAPRPTWVPFTPWTTLTDYLELLETVWREGLVYHVDSVQYAIRLLVPPGSALLDTPQFAPHQGPLQRDALSHAWRHPDPRMDALQARVATLVEAAAVNDSDAADTLRAIHAAALEAAGLPADPLHALAAPWQHPPAPRLSEPWFC